MRKLLAAALFAAVAVPVAGADDAADAARKLEGTYTVVEITQGGKPSPKAKEVEAVVIKDGQITIKGKDREPPVKFTVDPSKKPAHIDILPGNKDHDPIPGLYEAKETGKGLEVAIAFAKGGNGPRPKDFKGAGADDVVMRLLRPKAAK